VRFPSDEAAYRTVENGRDKNVMCFRIRSSSSSKFIAKSKDNFQYAGKESDKT